MRALSLAIKGSGGRSARRVAALLAAGALVGCAQAPTPVAHHRYHGREHFAEGFYVKSSARVIDDGQAITHGGGL